MSFLLPSVLSSRNRPIAPYTARSPVLLWRQQWQRFSQVAFILDRKEKKKKRLLRVFERRRNKVAPLVDRPIEVRVELCKCEPLRNVSIDRAVCFARYFTGIPRAWPRAGLLSHGVWEQCSFSVSKRAVVLTSACLLQFFFLFFSLFFFFVFNFFSDSFDSCEIGFCLAIVGERVHGGRKVANFAYRFLAAKFTSGGTSSWKQRCCCCETFA